MLIGNVSQVALNHIGILIVDEIQNVVNSKHGKTLVKMLTQLINNSGISICMVGTPICKDFFEQEKEHLSPSDAESITVSIKADRNVDMGVITDVKQALRRANVLKISYSAVQIEKKH